MFRSSVRLFRLAAPLAALALVVTSLVTARPAAAGPTDPSYIYGTVTDAATGQPLDNVCVVLGPALLTCIAHTDAAGSYRIDFPPGDLITSEQELHFLDRAAGYDDYNSPHFVVKGATRQDAAMVKPGAPPPPPGSTPSTCSTPGTPTQTLYLPNITRYLGGRDGWYTPFIVQNTGGAATTLNVSFYRFSDGSLVTCRTIPNLAPGTSFADVPTNDLDLPFDAQFSVVVKSFGSTIVSVVNEHAGAGRRSEAMSYVGAASGSTSVYLPNITRRFFGFDTPFIIQNLGAAQTTATARFVSFDGTAPTVTAIRVVDPGRSRFIDPNYEPGLVDGHQYAVTVTAAQPLSVVVNTQDDQPSVQYPKGYSDNGLVTGGAVLYGAYAAKNASGLGRSSPIVVQNMGAAPASPAITFTPLGGGSARTFDLGAIQPASSRVFDPRYANGDTAQPFCAGAVAGCLADGEYSFTVSAPGASLAAVVNVISTATAMGYAASPTVSGRTYFPNVTRTLGGSSGWTTPLVVQSAGATAVTLSWYRFSDGALVTTQVLPITPGAAIRVDPRDVSALSDNTQYSVVADGAGGAIAGLVIELATGGDSAMIYEGFTGP
ncbi:MAG TPA: hypothetical protein VGT60_09065 [Candidatus Limnocylindria bacterium]|nr:hypothetical protein [Candidatus Limnocylindria bacterium]